MSHPETSMTFGLAAYLRPGSHKVALGKGLESKTAVSVPDLVEQTNDFSTKNRPGCQPRLESSKPKQLFLDYNVTCHLATSDPKGHTVRVQFDVPKITDGTRANDLDVKVSCTCKAFLYWGAQWNTYQRDALEGEPRPELTAPTQDLERRGNFVICKHVASVCERILPSVQHNINKVVRESEVKRRTEETEDEVPSTREEKLQQRQEEMRKRFQKEKARRKKNKEVQRKLLEGIRRREEDIAAHNVIQRDTPATPEEQMREPELAPDKAAPLTRNPTEAPTVPQAKKPRQNSPNITVRDEVATTGKPLKPQKMPEMTNDDRKQMESLLQDEEEKDTEAEKPAEVAE